MTGCIRCCFWVRKVRIVSEVQVRLRQRSNPTERRVQETLYCEISTHALYLRQCPHVQATLLLHWLHCKATPGLSEGEIELEPWEPGRDLQDPAANDDS